MKDNGVSYKLSMQDYVALTQEVARIQQILARAEIVQSPKAAVVDVPLPTEARRPLPGADKMSGAAVRNPSDITRAEIEKALDISLDPKVITGAYSFYDLADVKRGWAPKYLEGHTHDERLLAPGEWNEDLPNMKRVLESFPAFRGFKVLMLVSMSVKQEDFPGEWKWTKRAPRPARCSGYEVVNLVMLANNGRLVTDTREWFGARVADELDWYDMCGEMYWVQCFPYLIAHGAERATNAFVTGFIPRLARAIQFSR